MAEWRRRAEESARESAQQAKEDKATSEREMDMFRNKNNAHWTLQLQTKEVRCCWLLVVVGWLVATLVVVSFLVYRTLHLMEHRLGRASTLLVG